MARTIIVGDVHGCVDELGRLLDALAPGAGDRVCFVGDLVARGPDSLGVLALYRAVNGQAVLGNHEYKLLAAHRARRSGAKRARVSALHYGLLHRLSEADWELLEALPLSLSLPEHGLSVVHAGVVPEQGLAVQDPWTLTHIRSIDPTGKPSPRHDFEPWAARYTGPHIVFGHNSRLGLQLAPHATGLDTGCVYGGLLTALVLTENQQIPADPVQRRELLRSVPAARAYHTPRESGL
jgi:calcineurin-like phosphoesterase family protein